VGYRSIRALRWIGFSEDDDQNQPPKAQDGSWLAGSQGRAKLGGGAASVSQRVEPPSPGYGAPGDNAFHLRALNERWIDFSEDDAFSRGRGNKMTPCEVHVFEKKFKFLSKKMLTRFRAFQLNSALLPRTTRENKKSTKSRKNVDTIPPFQRKMAAHPKFHL
jgi:hypothetical protein